VPGRAGIHAQAVERVTVGRIENQIQMTKPECQVKLQCQNPNDYELLSQRLISLGLRTMNMIFLRDSISFCGSLSLCFTIRPVLCHSVAGCSCLLFYILLCVSAGVNL
jgi:hypothetical protein